MAAASGTAGAVAAWALTATATPATSVAAIAQASALRRTVFVRVLDMRLLGERWWLVASRLTGLGEGRSDDAALSSHVDISVDVNGHNCDVKVSVT
ncbi:hypothetical protein Aau02nite_23970 [Amorphoplanes auranticolor]|uniref:Secreted protein n=1 Tax=Actinoplanes auranticolor TaxID=47988 RepID=A0A919S8H4_9ACTN|nr:hypothetical protein Aau02nite_23970 [Actinoplanes auranticolor]